MTAINFPDSPIINQVFSAAGRSWYWNGAVWNALGAGVPDNQLLSAISPIQYDSESQEISIDVSAINKPIEDISNVNITSVLDGQAIVYDSATSKWINSTVDVQGAIDEANAYTDLQISSIPPVDLDGYATESYVSSAIGSLVDSAPAALDTLNELAAALGDDASFATTITTEIASKSDKVVTFNQQSTNTYTLSQTDADKIIELDSASEITLTVPNDSTVSFPVGTTISILQSNLGQVAVVAASGVTINATPSLLLRTQWSSASLIKRAANTWLLSGDLE